MSWLLYFGVFCSSLAIASSILWFYPIINEAKRKGVSNLFTRKPILSGIIYCAITVVFAPFLVLPMISAKHEQRYIVGLKREIFKPD